MTAIRADDQPPPAADEAAVRALHQQSLDGWNQGSGEAFAAAFSPDANFVAFDGTLLRGRGEVARAHQVLFDRWLKGTRLLAERTTVRFIGADVAVVLTVGATIMPGEARPAPERDSIQTLVAARRDGAWSFVSFQNTRIRPIGAGRAAALLWLVPDRLWALFFRAAGAPPRASVSAAMAQAE